MGAERTWVCAAMLVLGGGCVNYSKVARQDAAVELKCPEDQIQVEETSATGHSVLLAASGCGQKATYQCWSESLEGPENRGMSKEVCALTGSSMPKPMMSENEARCRSHCREAGSACSSGCDGADCSAMCLALEDGCIDGCLRTIASQPPP